MSDMPLDGTRLDGTGLGGVRVTRSLGIAGSGGTRLPKAGIGRRFDTSSGAGRWPSW